MDTRKKARRIYTEEFRTEAVRLMNDRRRAGITLAQVGRELDLAPDVLRKWARELGAWTPDTHVPRPEPSTDAELQREVHRLRREVEVLRQEREFLKKATAYFAKESQ
jgi:transposase